MEQVRAFIAIELSREAKACIRELQARLKSASQIPAKWVDPEGIHLTLKFFGDVAVNKLDGIIGAMDTAAKGVSTFQLELKDLGVFPGLRRVQVAWVGLGGEIDKLKLLQQRVDSSLVPLGFAPESRPFTPHLTMARIRESASPEQRQEFGQLIARSKLEASCIIKVESINLMRSQLTREGAIYSQLGTAKLGIGSVSF